MQTPNGIESAKELFKKLELEGEQKVEDLMNAKNVSEETLMQIINEGNDEFKNATGRNMTYSEMRSLYG
jgi:O-phosphoseryl-tRNA(Cys) synthetase